MFRETRAPQCKTSPPVVGSKVFIVAFMVSISTMSVVSHPMAHRRARSGVEKRKPVKQTELCAFFSRGRCIRGNRCNFAHGIAELRPRPDLYKTKLCSSYSLWQQRPYGEACTHAHGQEELRSVAVFPDLQMQRLGDNDSKETFAKASAICDSELSVSSAVNQFGLPDSHAGPMMSFDYDSPLGSDSCYPITTPSDYKPPWRSLLHQMQSSQYHMQTLDFLAHGHGEVLSL